MKEGRNTATKQFCQNKKEFNSKVPSIRKEYVKTIFDSLRSQMQYHCQADRERLEQKSLLLKQVYEESFQCKSDIQYYYSKAQQNCFSTHGANAITQGQISVAIASQKQIDSLKSQLKKVQQKYQKCLQDQKSLRRQFQLAIDNKDRIIHHLQAEIRTNSDLNEKMAVQIAKNSQFEEQIYQLKQSLKRKSVRIQILEQQIKNLHAKAIKSKQRIKKISQRISIAGKINVEAGFFSRLRKQIEKDDIIDRQQDSDQSYSEGDQHTINQPEKAFALNSKVGTFRFITKKDLQSLRKNQNIVQNINSLKNLLDQSSNIKQEYQKTLQKAIQSQSKFRQFVNSLLRNFYSEISILKYQNNNLKNQILHNFKKFTEQFDKQRMKIAQMLTNDRLLNSSLHFSQVKSARYQQHKSKQNMQPNKSQFKGLRSKFFSQQEIRYLGWKI